jgi:hypothetical protein
MPEVVSHPGDIFEDCRYHPCLCCDISDDGKAIFGISLVDGSTIHCSISHCGVRKLTLAEAWRWKSEGQRQLPLTRQSHTTRGHALWLSGAAGSGESGGRRRERRASRFPMGPKWRRRR